MARDIDNFDPAAALAGTDKIGVAQGDAIMKRAALSALLTYISANIGTTFTRTLLDDAAAGNVLTTLGISAFVQTILDDAAAGNVLTTLGVSAFIQTLLDDADAATALATLGADKLRVLGQSGADASHTGDTVETILATVSVPAGAMGANGCLRITSLWNYTNSANAKTLRVRFGGIGGTSYLGQNLTTSANYLSQVLIFNNNAANAQKGMPSISASWGLSANAQLTGALDTASAQDIVFTGLLALGSEAITLEAYTVELIKL